MCAQIAPEAALLVSTEWRAAVKGVVRIDPDGACLNLGGHAMRQLDVLGPDRRYQTVHGSISDRDRLIRTPEPDSRQHRSENLLLCDLHIRLHFGKNRRLNKKALTVRSLD